MFATNYLLFHEKYFQPEITHLSASAEFRRWCVYYRCVQFRSSGSGQLKLDIADFKMKRQSLELDLQTSRACITWEVGEERISSTLFSARERNTWVIFWTYSIERTNFQRHNILLLIGCVLRSHDRKLNIFVWTWISRHAGRPPRVEVDLGTKHWPRMQYTQNDGRLWPTIPTCPLHKKFSSVRNSAFSEWYLSTEYQFVSTKSEYISDVLYLRHAWKLNHWDCMPRFFM